MIARREFIFILSASLLLIAVAGCGSGQLDRAGLEEKLREQLNDDDPEQVKEALERYSTDGYVPDDVAPKVFELITESPNQKVRVKAAHTIGYARDIQLMDKVQKMMTSNADEQVSAGLRASYGRMVKYHAPGITGA